MSETFANLTPEQIREIPMVDLAFGVLKAANTPYYYRDLMAEVAKIKGFTEEDIMKVIAQLYTEINVDGRFACVGNNLWGLKRWYPIDNKEGGDMGSTKRPRIINDDDDDLDEEEYVEEEEDTYTAEEEDFDTFDEDRDEMINEEEEEEIFTPDEIEEDLEDTEDDAGDADESEEEDDAGLDEEFDDDSDDDDK